MDEEPPAPDFQSPEERAVAIASIICFLCLLLNYWAENYFWDKFDLPPVGRLTEWMIWTSLPLCATFAALGCSCWRPEITGIRRIGLLLLASCLILLGVLAAIPLALGILWFCFNSVTVTSWPG